METVNFRTNVMKTSRSGAKSNFSGDLLSRRKMGVNKIAEEVGVSKMTLYKYLRHRKVEISSYNKTIKLV